ncbi:hypothetical protein [Streptomyces sp. NRRL S-475]|uniref:hypothetical protein n=1 Tax=Streptomyces sp. NRRL S-475 TaxID=1463910 RepID=UPI0004C73937|nr:hypothetical protein [Streptomyces sp. NRRL S-475]
MARLDRLGPAWPGLLGSARLGSARPDRLGAAGLHDRFGRPGPAWPGLLGSTGLLEWLGSARPARPGLTCSARPARMTGPHDRPA